MKNAFVMLVKDFFKFSTMKKFSFSADMKWNLRDVTEKFEIFFSFAMIFECFETDKRRRENFNVRQLTIALLNKTNFQ